MRHPDGDGRDGGLGSATFSVQDRAVMAAYKGRRAPLRSATEAMILLPPKSKARTAPLAKCRLLRF